MVLPDAPAPSPARFSPYRIDHVLRGDAARGCARGTIAGGRAVLVRWGPAGEDLTVSGPRREHEALREVSAHGTPEPIEMFESDGLVVSVSGWIDGESLLRRRPPDLVAAATELMEILDRAHSVGWVHGDLSPSNVLVDDAGHIHLVDWDLAARTGTPAEPGTLGYSPPAAWLPGFVADAAGDCYAASVVLAEVALGRRLFEGDRTEILEGQRHAAGEIGAVRALGGPWAGIADTIEAGGRREPIQALHRLGRVRVSRLGVIVARSVGDAVASRVLSAMSGPVTEPLGVSTPGDCDPADVALAVVESLRTRHRLRCVPLEAIVPADSVPPDVADENATRADSARATRAHRIRVLREYAEAVVGGVVVASNQQVATLGGGGWLEVAEAARPLSGTPPARLAQLIPKSESDRSLGRDAIAAAIAEVLRPAAADVEAVSLIHELGPSSAHDVVWVLSALTRDGVLREVTGVVAADRGRWSQVAGAVLGSYRTERAPRMTGSNATESSRAVSDRDPASFEAAVAWGEAAAIAGLPSQVVRACIRATTNVISNSDVDDDERIRLCDLWLDVGRPDAGLQVLECSKKPMGAELLLRRAQCLVGLERFAEAAQVGQSLSEVANSSSHHLEALRLQCLGAMSVDQLEVAASILRRGRKWRRAATLGSRLLFDITVANCLRRTGRSRRAVRLLQTVMRIAESRGSVRLALMAETNLVLAEPRTSVFVADRFERIAAQFRRWGLVVQAATNLLRAAREWMAADDVDAALRNMRDVRSDIGLGVWIGARAVAELRVRESEAFDRKDAPHLIAWESTDGAGDATSIVGVGDPESHRALLELERNPGEARSARRGSRGSPSRALQTLVNLVRRSGRTVPFQRVERTIRMLSSRIHPRSPMLGHAVRWVVRSSTTAGELSALLRQGSHPEVAGRSLSECVGVASCVWATDVSRDVAWWVLTELPREERKRPPGTRVWEFHLALAVAESVVGHLEDGQGCADRVLRAVDAFVVPMPPDEAAEYLRGVPWARILGLAGVAADRAESVVSAGSGESILAAARNLIRGDAQSASGGDRREAGLRRVQRAALRLRATGTLDEVLGEVALGVLEVCRAERALVLYDTGAGGPRAKLATYTGVTTIEAKAAEFSEGVLERVRATNGVCIVDDAADDSQLGHRPSVKQMGARSVMVAPLRTATRHFGFLYVENRSLPRSFGEADRELIEGFAAQAALALENNQLVEELRASNRDLAHARGEAVRSENLRVLGRMAGEVAHDFNNLLTAILGEAQLLMEDPRARGLRDRLSVIERAALDGASTIRRIQDSTRVRTDADFEAVDLGQVVRDVVDLTRVRWASGRRVGPGAIELAVEAPRGVVVHGIGSELREVVTNIVVNAVDAMPEGGRLAVAVAVDGDLALVRVTDAGCGMPPEVVARIFDPFFTTKGSQGNGLGLSIAHGIVKRHGGEIRVDSEVGRGTTMTISLPSAPADASGEGWVARVRNRSVSAQAAVRRALVVDDDPSVLRVVSELLRSEGYVVETAAGGSSALVRIQGLSEPYDLILTDLFMPDVNGLDVAAEVRRRGAAHRTIVMSGCTMTLQGGALEGHLVDAVLRKPFSREELRVVS